MITDKELAEYATTKYPPAAEWPEGTMEAWLSWASTHGFLMVATDQDKITGILFAKPVKRPPKEDHSYDYDRNGSYIYINFAAVDNLDAARVLAWAALQNIGPRRAVMYKSRGQLKIKMLEPLLKSLFKVKQQRIITV